MKTGHIGHSERRPGVVTDHHPDTPRGVREAGLSISPYRGFYGPMQYLHALIGITFIVIALIHAPLPDPFSWVPYAIAAVLAFISLKPEISLPISRVLAIGTTVLMFIFFAGFFVVVPSLEADWYRHQAGWDAVSRILGAFAMIPILSDYSCRLKAECREARMRSGRHAFFSVPDHIRPR